MSQRLLTTDDHSGAEIESGIDSTQASITISRNGAALTWEGLNLTDESWAALTALLTDFLPGVTPAGCLPDSQEPVDPEQAAYEAQQEAAQTAAVERVITEQATQRQTQPTTARRTASRNGKALTQAEQRARSKAMRTWWYELPQGELNKLGLPTPDRTKQIGKLPVAVTDAYASTHEAA